MTSQWVMMLLGVCIVKSIMGNDVARDVHSDVTMSNDIAMFVCMYVFLYLHIKYGTLKQK